VREVGEGGVSKKRNREKEEQKEVERGVGKKSKYL
jgi:hypothetical protein